MQKHGAPPSTCRSAWLHGQSLKSPRKRQVSSISSCLVMMLPGFLHLRRGPKLPLFRRSKACHGPSSVTKVCINLSFIVSMSTRQNWLHLAPLSSTANSTLSPSIPQLLPCAHQLEFRNSSAIRGVLTEPRTWRINVRDI